MPTNTLLGNFRPAPISFLFMGEEKLMKILFFKPISKKRLLTSMSGTPKCPYCNGTDVIDNGDNWYCYACNATFGDM